MNPGVGWIAQFEALRAATDESLAGLLKIAQEGSQGQTEAFLNVLDAANALDPDARSWIVAAAVIRLAWETHP